jgi:hypothetical protein
MPLVTEELPNIPEIREAIIEQTNKAQEVVTQQTSNATNIVESGGHTEVVGLLILGLFMFVFNDFLKTIIKWVGAILVIVCLGKLLI